MVLHTYITPRNNEFKERIKETRYMSYNDTISVDIKRLMDIDIVRDLANKAMYLNDKLPYDVASINAKQIYLGEPIKGIEIPLIEEEEDIDLTSSGLYIENPNFKVETPIVSEKVEETPVIPEPSITNLESIYSEEYLKEQKKQEMIIDSSFVDELISEPDIVTEEPIIDSSFVDKLITESDDSVILNPSFEDQKEVISNESSIDDNMIIENTSYSEVISNNKNSDLIIEEEIIKEPIEEVEDLENTFDLSNMLSELPAGMLDEIPTKDMLEELPIGEELPKEEPVKEDGLIINSDLLDSLQKENTSDLLDIISTDFKNVKYTDLIINKQDMPKQELILDEEETLIEEQVSNDELIVDTISQKEEELLPDLPLVSSNDELLEELASLENKEELIEELPKEEELLEELPSLENKDSNDDLFDMVGLVMDDLKKEDTKEELLIEDDLLESLDVDKLIEDIKLEQPVKEELLEELPKIDSKEELLEPLDINLEEMKNETLIEEQVSNDELLIDTISQKEEELLPDLPLVSSNDELLEELPSLENKEELIEELPKEEELLEELPKIEEPLQTNNLEDLSNLADNILKTESLTSFETKEESKPMQFETQSIDPSQQLLANLTNGFTMDFLDEPVMQKVKTR